ncbi:transcriptional regulator [Yersinia pseudotuberculosis]|uniref:Transcriptional regulator n=1 Tax=Yersinia pseudotuberculosis TaxID=633 RepID=A0ABN5RAC4_YERPU|nr:transcriptional regulator [Yersinia pseudotuberculosis]AYW88222.1 transcriptional regulator [Yersinia pseudotuberculosis]AYW93372.1 transcriptional regulator [Yersinia pseudotuberculosis]AYW97536.1 transcriptional regulator [Yersinia pseudotuberculosis]AYW98971.1 transcriptional regulator [Yersinia pseudotuberculosis]AZA30533.1 transcriptional regulator [Yersinia pseudotuberculosis]
MKALVLLMACWTGYESHFKRFLRDSTCQLPRCWVVVQDD